MAADTVQLVVERERELEANINAERERLANALETHARELEATRLHRIEARSSLYERQLAALSRELEEQERDAIEQAKRNAAVFDLSEEHVDHLTQQVLNGFSWRPSPSTK